MRKLSLSAHLLAAVSAGLPTDRGGVVGHQDTPRAPRDIEELAAWRALGLGASPDAAGRALATLRTDLSTAQARPEVPADAVVLADAADRARWEAFRALNVEPAAIEAERTELVQLRAKDVARSKKDARAAAAVAAGYNAEALHSIAGVDDFTFAVRQEKVRDAKGVETTVDVAYITPPGDI